MHVVCFSIFHVYFKYLSYVMLFLFVWQSYCTISRFAKAWHAAAQNSKKQVDSPSVLKQVRGFGCVGTLQSWVR